MISFVYCDVKYWNINFRPYRPATLSIEALLLKLGSLENQFFSPQLDTDLVPDMLSHIDNVTKSTTISNIFLHLCQSAYLA